MKRWGALLVRPSAGYVASFADVTFAEGALDMLFRAHQAGWHVYLVGNEDAVAQGKFSDTAWEAFEADLLAHLGRQGVPVCRSYACLDHPEGAGEHRKDSVFLFPNTGALYHAAQHDGIDLERSWIVSDCTLELVAGWRAGCRIAGVKTGLALEDGNFNVEPEYVSPDLAAALGELLALERAASR